MKFKVGDQIRINKKIYPASGFINKVGKIIQISLSPEFDTLVTVDWSGAIWSYDPKQLLLVKEANDLLKELL